MVGGAVIAPMLYLFLNQWKGVGFPLACWAVIGGAAGWDLARMLLGEKVASRKRQPSRHQPAADWELFDEAAEQHREILAQMEQAAKSPFEGLAYFDHHQHRVVFPDIEGF